MEECLATFYENPDEMYELIDCLAELCRYIQTDALFRHNDWGSQISTFPSAQMFWKFIKRLYEDLRLLQIP